MMYTTDVLVVGSGLAGLSAALRANSAGVSVIVASLGMGASPYVNGFQAWHDGSPEGYRVLCKDMLDKGANLNDMPLMHAGIARSHNAFPTLLEYGVPFITDENKVPIEKTAQTEQGAFSRGYKTKGELGKNALPVLKQEAKKRGVLFLDGTEVLLPIVNDGRIIGAVGVCKGEWVYLRAKSVILACGGIGSLVKSSTYPKDVFGGYVLMALLAGAELVDMEFLQYEPAVCCGLPEMGRMPLPTGFWKQGARLINKNGERFFKKRYGLDEKDFSKNGPTDKNLIARRIYQEVCDGNGLSNGGIWYDATEVAPERINQFTYKVKRLASVGVDMSKTPIEVSPGAHSHTGGVHVDEYCASKVPGLYAAGESAGGFLGAGRMAGFGGTSAVALGDLAGESAAEYVSKTEHASEDVWEEAKNRSIHWAASQCAKYDVQSDTYDKISSCLDRCFHIVKNEELLQEGMDCLNELQRVSPISIPMEDLPNAIRTYGAICSAQVLFGTAMKRKESRGAFYRDDYPYTDEQWQKSQIVGMDGNGNLYYNMINRDLCNV